MKNSFEKAPLFIKILSATVACYGLSFLLSGLGGFNQARKFPLGVAKQYEKVIKGVGAQNHAETKQIISVKGLDEIELNLNSTDLVLEQSPSDQVEIDYSGVASHFIKDQIEGKKLILAESEKESGGKGFYFSFDDKKEDQGFHFVFNVEDSKFRIKIPAAIKKLNLHLVSGDLTASSLNFDELKIEKVSGDLTLRKLKAKTLQLKTVSGDVHIDGDVDQMKVRSVSGDQKYALSTLAPQSEITSTSGDIHFTLSKKVDSRVEFSSTSGDASWSNGASAKMGKGAGLIQIHTVSGDLSVGLKDSPARTEE